MIMRTIVHRALTRAAVAGALLSFAAPALADEDAPAAESRERPGAGEKGFFITAKVGGIVPFGGLGPNVTGGMDLGYALDNGFAFGIAGDYAAPKQSGTESDARVAGGTYSWHLTQQMLQVMPFILYRIRSLDSIVPYVGIGPRMYFLRSFVRSDDGGPQFRETREQSTRFGVGVPIGMELRAGPGAVIAELLLQYGTINHTVTGEAHSGAASLAVGYRFMF
jgi:hypothetical protein